MSRLRILCLHGFTSNGSVHAHQVRHLTSSLSANFDFIFPDAPHIVNLSSQMDLSNPSTKAWSEYVSANSSGVGHRAWWYARDPDPITKKTGGFVGLETSLKFLGDMLERTGPVHAIWGFSQGACLAGMLVALLGEENRGYALRAYLPQEQGTPAAGIFFSGFKARFEQYEGIYAPGIDIPTMHIMGLKDLDVSVQRSEDLVGICQDPEVLKHPAGHDIPKLVEDREKIIRFLRRTCLGEDRPSL